MSKKSRTAIKNCLFCETSNNMSREHLWSDWIKSLLPEDAKYHEFRATYSGSEPKIIRESSRTRGGTTGSKKIKAVCTTCNTGWMSRIETEVKPILSALISGKPLLLTEEYQLILATWISLKLLIAEHNIFDGHPSDPIFSQEVRNEFITTKKTPYGFRIWIASHSSAAWQTRYFVQTGTFNYSTSSVPVTTKDRPKRNVQIFSWGIGSIVIYAIATTNEEVYRLINPIRNENIFFNLWPITKNAVYWPSQFSTLSDSEVDKIPMIFQRYIEESWTLINRA